MNSKSSQILYFLKPYKLLYLGTVCLSLLVAALDAFNLALLLPVMNYIFGIFSSSISSSSRLLFYIDKIISLLPFQQKIISAISLLIFFTIIKCAFSILNESLISYASAKMLYDTRKNLLNKYAQANYQYFLDNKQGEMNHNLLVASGKLSFLFMKLPLLLAEILKVSAIIIILFTINLYVTLFFIPLAIIFNFFVGFLSRNVSHIIGIKKTQASNEQAVIFHEFISGAKQIKVYLAKDRWLKGFDIQNKEFSKLYMKDYIWLSIPRNIFELVTISILFGLVLFIDLHHTANITKELPTLGVFAMALLKLFPSSANIARIKMEIIGTLPELQATYKVLNMRFESIKAGSAEFTNLNKGISFENVCFTYKNNILVLDNINIQFEKNKVTAIAGISGSGKTTIVNLLLGLYQPTQGRILIDDRVELNEYKTESWLSKIGIVTQDSFIFHSTVEDNIIFGLAGAKSEQVEEASRLANAHDFIMDLPQGYKTIVGERGMKLSGGQQQRIAIARAILRNPQILIFDEAMSNLDSASERLIHESLKKIVKNRTIILIAHRLSTIVDADKIIIIKDGAIHAEGRHEQLLQKNAFYRDLYLGR